VIPSGVRKEVEKKRIRVGLHNSDSKVGWRQREGAKKRQTGVGRTAAGGGVTLARNTKRTVLKKNQLTTENSLTKRKKFRGVRNPTQADGLQKNQSEAGSRGRRRRLSITAKVFDFYQTNETIIKHNTTEPKREQKKKQTGPEVENEQEFNVRIVEQKKLEKQE